MHWTILLPTILLVRRWSLTSTVTERDYIPLQATEVFCHNDARLPRAPGDAQPSTPGGKPATPEQKDTRSEITIPEASNKVDVPPVLAQSQNVPTFDEHTFTSLYPMRCGTKATGLENAIARCMPDINDIVVVSEDDQLDAKTCPRVLVCEPSKTKEEICDKKSIKLWFPSNQKLVTNTGVGTSGSSGNLDVKKGELVMSLDPGCDMTFKGGPHKMRHRFQNKPKKIREMMNKYPGFYLLPVFPVKRRLNRGGNNIFIGTPTLWTGRESLKQIACHAACDLGQIITYKLLPGELFYSKIWVDGHKCEWFKICVQGGGGVKSKKFFCYDTDLLSVYVRAGFVVMPGAQNGVAIRLVKSTASKGKTRKDQMSYRPTQIGFDYDGFRFSVWSVGRERVASSSNVAHDGDIIFYFSHHNCLIKRKQKGYGGIMNMGPQNGIVYQIDVKKPIDGVSNFTEDISRFGTAGTRPTLGTMATAPPTPNVSAEAKATTTQKIDLEEFFAKGYGTDVKKGRKGWLIWAIFYGFFVGSAISLLIFGSFLYFGRRNVYQDWYRGMYKRYGVDASGVTGGVTGSAFGTTTTGVGGLSTIGGTTLGTTGGTTTGGTSGFTSGFTSGMTGGETSGSTTGGTTGGTTDVSGTTGGTSDVSGTTGGTDVSGTTGGTTGGGTSTGGDVSGTSGTSAAL